MSDILIETDEGGGSAVIFNRPDALNAFTTAMLAQIADAIERLSAAQDTSAIVLEGAGRGFSAGVDLKALQGLTPKAGRIAGPYDAEARRIAAAIRSCPKPVIAKVHGVCFTGALEIALHCDMLYTTEDAKFGDTHGKWGLRPSWGMSQTLRQAVGARRARELSFTARVFSGAEAAAWGLANDAASSKSALDALVARRVGEIAACSPEAIAAMKDLYQIQDHMPLAPGLAEEDARAYPDITDTAARLKRFGA